MSHVAVNIKYSRALHDRTLSLLLINERDEDVSINNTIFSQVQNSSKTERF